MLLILVCSLIGIVCIIDIGPVLYYDTQSMANEQENHDNIISKAAEPRPVSTDRRPFDNRIQSSTDTCASDIKINESAPRSRSRWTWRLIGRLVGVYAAMIPAGMSYAVIGAILLELGRQTDTGLDKLALLFTWNFIGRFVSSFTVSAIFDRMHPEMQLGVISLVFIITVSVIPMTRHYGVVSAAIAVMGSCTGYLTTGGTSTVFFLFINNGSPAPFIQANYFAMAVGSMLAPLVVKPFLSLESGLNPSGFGYNSTKIGVQPSDNSTSQVSFGMIEPGTFYPAMIICAAMFIPAIFLWLQFIKDKCNARRHNRSSSEAKQVTSEDPVIIILLCIAFYCGLGVEITYGGLLYTYAVKGCNWDQQSANNLITVFWITYTVTRGVSILVTKVIRPQTILAVTIPIMVAMMVLMAAASQISPVILWISAAGNAVAMSLQLGTWFLVGNDFFPVSGRLAGLFMASVYMGGMTVPAMTGYLFKSVNQAWMCYILLFLSIVLLVVYVTLCIYDRYRKGRKTECPPTRMSGETKAADSLLEQ